MRRSFRYRTLPARTLQLVCALAFLLSIIDILPVREPAAPDSPLKKERIFVASIHWNNERVLREHWVPALVQLATTLGPGNVYVSVQQSGSWDDSKGALRLLDQSLDEIGVRRRIILDETTHKEEVNQIPGESGWTRTPSGRTELRRIPYLARLRNIVLDPLVALEEAGEHFDKVLFINDVVFTVRS